MRPADGDGLVLPENGGWTDIFAPSAIPFSDRYITPKPLKINEIASIVQAFGDAAARAVAVGFQTIELHSAHGYLLHEFLSPLSNKRQDEYGGSLENRARMLREVVQSVRKRIPEDMALWVRLSCTEWSEGGFAIEEAIEVARTLPPLGVDLIDCSSGGNVRAKIPVGPGYQTPFAERIRKETGIPTAAVGMITSAIQAEHILQTGQADMILLAREFLRDPYWPLHAAQELGVAGRWPVQYLRSAPPGSVAR
jgi:2,4-dienoyl-CoA reductase-like NADH-dependent reductase (Old Yellow Enzyme family)